MDFNCEIEGENFRPQEFLLMQMLLIATLPATLKTIRTCSEPVFPNRNGREEGQTTATWAAGEVEQEYPRLHSTTQEVDRGKRWRAKD